VIEPNEIGEEK